MSDEAFQLAASALRHADRSRQELEERLERAGHDEQARATALDRLEELGWLDDVRTAVTRADHLAGRGYGDAYIRAELGRRGLPVDAALAALDPEPERAQRHAGRGATWLARRGFDFEVVAAFAEDRREG